MTGPKGALPVAFPVFPLAGALLLPRGRLPLNIFEPRYLAMVDDALRTSRVIGMVQPADDAAHPRLYPVGCLGRIVSWHETGDGRFGIELAGVSRFRIAEELPAATPYRQVRASYDGFATDLDARSSAAPCLDRTRLGAGLAAYMKQRKMSADLDGLEAVPDEVLVNSLAMICPFDAAEKQALLEAPDLSGRAKLLTALIEMAAAIRHRGSVQ